MNQLPEKKSSERSIETNGINGSRNLIRGLLAGISIGLVSGIAIGKWVGGNDKKPEDDKPAPCIVTPDDKPSFAYETLKKRIDEMNKIKKTTSEWNAQNMGVCDMSDDEVLDEAKEICRETALEFARAIGISNEYDIDQIISLCLQGYSIEGFTHSRSGAQQINFLKTSFNNAGMEDMESDYVLLSDEINEDTISSEHRAPEDNELSSEEKELNKKMENSDYKGIVDSFDSQSVLDAARNDTEAYEFFSGLIKIALEARDLILSDTTNDDIKVAIAYNFPFKVGKYIENFPEDLFQRIIDVPEYMQFFNYLVDYFMEALPGLAGIEADSYECAKGLSGIIDECIQEKLGNKF